MKDSAVFDIVDAFVGATKDRITTSFYPSDASCEVNGKIVGRCLRYQYFKWKGYHGERMKYRTWLAAELGRGFEGAFLKAYKSQGLLRAANVPFRAVIMGLPISGRLDGLTKDGRVIECKSAYGKAFFYSVNNAPKPEHLCQIMVYLAVLGLDECILPYGSRDDSGSRVGYRIRKREIEDLGIYFIKIIARWKKLQSYLEKDETPPPDFTLLDWRCRYCQFMRSCWSQGQIDEWFEGKKKGK